MKGPGASRLRPVNRFSKPMTEDGKSCRCRIQDGAQSLFPGKRQIPRTEENRYQIVSRVQFRHPAEAASLCERPPKLGDETAEFQVFDRKVADDENHPDFSA